MHRSISQGIINANTIKLENAIQGGDMVIRVIINFLFVLCYLLFSAVMIEAQTGSMSAANVVVSQVSRGTISTVKNFIGTVYYPEVSDVSTQVSGAVKAIHFDEGQQVLRDDILIELDSDLLNKSLQAKEASYKQVLTDLERSQKEFERIRTLYARKIISEKDYDSQYFEVTGLEQKAAAMKAEVERLEIEFEKTNIRVPFDGIVVKKHVARGEWVSPGSPVATIALNKSVDVVVNVPEEMVYFLKSKREVKMIIADRERIGRISAVIPRGDVATRTFPVKIRVDNSESLLEGMEAKVMLSSSEQEAAFIVPRDALLKMENKTVVVAVIDGKAVFIPVTVVAYQDMNAGIQSPKIFDGMSVVVKGNERLKDGQPLVVMPEVKSE